MNYKLKGIKTIIFDLDGTLYPLKEGSFLKSPIYQEMRENSIMLIQEIMNVSKEEAEKNYHKIFDSYNGELSVGFEKEFNLNKTAYFNRAWNLDPAKYIEVNEPLIILLRRLKKNFTLILLSDAPEIWIQRVLNHLGIVELFKDHIFNGQGEVKKSRDNALDFVISKNNLLPEECLVVGDQEKTDILPAVNRNMSTVYINKDKSSFADYTITNILEISKILEETIK